MLSDSNSKIVAKDEAMHRPINALPEYGSGFLCINTISLFSLELSPFHPLKGLPRPPSPGSSPRAPGPEGPRLATSLLHDEGHRGALVEQSQLAVLLETAKWRSYVRYDGI